MEIIAVHIAYMAYGYCNGGLAAFISRVWQFDAAILEKKDTRKQVLVDQAVFF